MKKDIRGEKENTDGLTSMFSAETIQSIGEAMDAVDVHDKSRQYTVEEAKKNLKERCPGYDPDIH